MSVLRQARRIVRQIRNQNAFSTAQMHRTYVCSHLKEGATSPGIEEFLPHGAEWHNANSEPNLKIKRQTAIDFLTWHELLDADLQAKVEPFLKEIEYIAQG